VEHVYAFTKQGGLWLESQTCNQQAAS